MCFVLRCLLKLLRFTKDLLQSLQVTTAAYFFFGNTVFNFSAMLFHLVFDQENDNSMYLDVSISNVSSGLTFLKTLFYIYHIWLEGGWQAYNFWLKEKVLKLFTTLRVEKHTWMFFNCMHIKI